MIPADHFKFSDDGTTAWWVLPPFDAEVELSEDNPAFLDRPCDGCEGGQAWWTAVQANPCPACFGSGRHCFDITVEWPVCEPECPVIHPGRTLTVSVVPGMVLPMFDWTGTYDPARTPAHLSLSRDGTHWTYFPQQGHGRTSVIKLPSAAPGMTAVLLNIHKGTTP